MTLQQQIDRLVAHQAAEWYETLRLGNERQHPEFIRWVSESPRHMEAFLAIASEASAMRTIFAGKAFDLGDLLKQVSPDTLPLPATHATPSLAAHVQHKRWQWPTAIAACLVATVTALWFGLNSGQDIETAIGEQRVVPLADGSVLNLNALSRVEVRLSKHARDIELTHGEVLFKVAADKARPFRVHTPNAVVQAVGTQFNVYVRPDGNATVSVVEGKVQILPSTGTTGTHEIWTAGQEAQIAKAGTVERNEGANINDAVAWQRRKLIFKRTSLENIAAEFNRYNKAMRLRVDQVPPGTFIFSGAFDADDPGSLADLLAREPDLTVQRTEHEIVIRRR
ncbi:FecR family protein [Steroidobacter sp.]|uniref:FecR family protein n=1 Tax=Steroidobacter sp. TaxID=1978227 RepID=UPI001A5786E3|nr:FecR domain-containing protein [Steroidobacter sp.]MBL8269222.1 FecR domain-containing protein [Steroidobacter sp.]